MASFPFFWRKKSPFHSQPLKTVLLSSQLWVDIYFLSMLSNYSLSLDFMFAFERCIDVSLSFLCLFYAAAFKIFVFGVLQSSHTVTRCGFLFIYLIRYVLYSQCLWHHVFHQFWKFSAIISSVIASPPFSLYSLSGTFTLSTIAFHFSLRFSICFSLCCSLCNSFSFFF